jgi:hypothetical protein
MYMNSDTPINPPAAGVSDEPPEMSDDHALADVLRWFGWRLCGEAAWSRPTPMGSAQLQRLHEGTTWHRYEISGGSITAPSVGRYLHVNGLLPGPFKFVAQPRDGVRCRCDWPALEPDLSSDLPPAPGITAEPWSVQWVRAVTRFVEGRELGAPHALDLAELVERLTHSGRSATRDGDRVLVHFQRPGAFAQIRCELDPRVGPRLAADLLTLAGRRSSSHRAAVRLAAEANRRLPWVRFALGESEPPVLSCEVCFGDALIPSAWLAVALEALEAAMSLTLREMQALRDPTLARLLVAVPTA